MSRKWLPCAFLIVVLPFSRSWALHISDLFPVPGDSTIVSLIHAIGTTLEPFVQTTGKDWKYPVPRDSVRAAAYRVLSRIDALGGTGTGSQLVLLKGLVWYYLSRLDVDSAFEKSDSISEKALKANPGSPGVAWFRAVLSIEGMRTLRGLAMLDSLRNNGMSGNSNFMLDYERLCAESFLPNGQSYAENIRIQSDPQLDISDLLTERELIPFKKSWDVTMESHARGIEYTFTTGFILQELMNLQFPNLNGHRSSEPLLQFDSTFNVKFYPPRIDLFDGMFTMELQILVDINNFTIPLQEYVYSLVNNRFDFIESRHDLAALKAVSVRCYKRYVFQNVSGDYYAYIAFDCNRCIMPGRFSPQTTPGKRRETVPLRYLIVMKTSQPVAAKSEAILANFLSQFEAAVN